MHLITVTERNPLGLNVGEQYVAEDVNAGELLSRGWCRVEGRSKKEELRGFDPDRDWNNKRILFVRPGGFGDLLFLTPTLHEIVRRWPLAQIYVACFEPLRSVLEHNPDVEGFVRYPVPLGAWMGFDAHVWLEGVIEQNPLAREMHAVDVVAERTGMDLTDQFGSHESRKGMRYFLTAEELRAAEDEFPKRDDVPRVGFQMSATGACRQYPHMGTVSQILWGKHGCEIFLFGKPGELVTNEFPLASPGSSKPMGIVNLTKRPSSTGTIGKTFRESVAVLATCDVVVAPDSALTHVAGALMQVGSRNSKVESGGSSWRRTPVPCVALYAPFPWQLRTANAPETRALQGHGPCAPCFHHHRPGRGVFPSHGPCAKTRRCEVLASIDPQRVVREVLKQIENVPREARADGRIKFGSHETMKGMNPELPL